MPQQKEWAAWPPTRAPDRWAAGPPQALERQQPNIPPPGPASSTPRPATTLTIRACRKPASIMQHHAGDASTGSYHHSRRRQRQQNSHHSAHPATRMPTKQWHPNHACRCYYWQAQQEPSDHPQPGAQTGCVRVQDRRGGTCSSTHPRANTGIKHSCTQQPTHNLGALGKLNLHHARAEWHHAAESAQPAGKQQQRSAWQAHASLQRLHPTRECSTSTQAVQLLTAGKLLGCWRAAAADGQLLGSWRAAAGADKEGGSCSCAAAQQRGRHSRSGLIHLHAALIMKRALSR